MSTAMTPPQGNDQTRENPRVGADGRVGGTRPGPDHREVAARQKEEFGGMKFGAGFFGWLAATGMAVLLTAIVAGVATAIGVNQNVDPTGASTGALQTAGIVGGIVLLVVVFVAYFCGGYVAGRMARFNGLKQGLAVWLWAIIITIVLGVLGAILGSQADMMSRVNSLPNLGVDTNRFTWAGVLAVVAVAVVSLLGAILGGLAGMRFHRRVDRVGLS
jgi:hypothetical protein